MAAGSCWMLDSDSVRLGTWKFRGVREGFRAERRRYSQRMHCDWVGESPGLSLESRTSGDPGLGAPTEICVPASRTVNPGRLSQLFYINPRIRTSSLNSMVQDPSPPTQNRVVALVSYGLTPMRTYAEARRSEKAAIPPFGLALACSALGRYQTRCI